MFLTKKTIPNLISLSRIIMLVAIYWLFETNPATAFLIFLLAALTDWFDGLAARWLNAQSELGAILDPLADKILYVGTLWILSFILPIYWTFVFTVIPEALLVAIRFPPLKTWFSPKIPATSIGKIKMWLQCLAIIFMMLWTVSEIPALLVLGITLANISIVFSWWSLWSHFQNR